MTTRRLVAIMAVIVGGAFLTAAVPAFGILYGGAVAFTAIYTCPIKKN